AASERTEAKMDDSENVMGETALRERPGLESFLGRFGGSGTVTASQRQADPRPRPLVSVETLPIIAVVLEFVLITVTTFAAGVLYHELVFGFLPRGTFYAAATCTLAGLVVGPSVLAWDYSVNHLNDAREQIGRAFRR